MEKYDISELKLEAICNSMVLYDKNFFLFLPDTVITLPILQFLSQQHSILYYQSDEQITVPDTTELLEDEYIEIEQAIALHNKYSNEHQSFAQAFKDYPTMSSDFSQIVDTVRISGNINYTTTKQFVYDVIIPQVHKNPFPYLAMGEFDIEDNHEKIYGLLLRCMLFSVALLETDHKKTFFGIEKQVTMALSALFCNIGIITVLDKLSLDKRNISFISREISKLISQVSLIILKQSSVPQTLYEVAEESQKHLDNKNYQDQYKRQTYDIFQFINITNTYVYLTAFTSIDGPIQPLQALQTLSSPTTTLFDLTYVKTIVNILSVVPPGMYVELKNKCKGITLIPQPKTPKSPIVQLITTANGKGTSKLDIISTNHPEFALKNFVPIKEIPALRLHRKKTLARFLE